MNQPAVVDHDPATVDWGRTSFPAALRRQEQLVAKRLAGKSATRSF